MALTAAGIFASLNSAKAAGPYPFAGPHFPLLANGISQAVAVWAVNNPVNVQLTGMATGALGAGQILPALTRIIVPPNFAIVQGALSGAGLNGPLSPSLVSVLSVAFSNAFTTQAQYMGFAPAVGTGQDISKITVANAGTLVPLLMAFIGGSMGVGPMLPQLSLGIANAVSGLLLGGTGTGTVTGGSGPSPSAGISTSVVI